MSIGATSDNVQEIMDAVEDKMMEMYMMECGGDMFPDFDWLAAWFADMNL